MEQPPQLRGGRVFTNNLSEPLREMRPDWREPLGNTFILQPINLLSKKCRALRRFWRRRSPSPGKRVSHAGDMSAGGRGQGWAPLGSESFHWEGPPRDGASGEIDGCCSVCPATSSIMEGGLGPAGCQLSEEQRGPGTRRCWEAPPSAIFSFAAGMELSGTVDRVDGQTSSTLGYWSILGYGSIRGY